MGFFGLPGFGGDGDADQPPELQISGRFQPTDVFSPEVLAGLNPTAVETVFNTPDKLSALLTLQTLRPGSILNTQVIDRTNLFSPEILAGLNPDAVNRVINDPGKTAQVAVLRAESIERLSEDENVFQRIGGVGAGIGRVAGGSIQDVAGIGGGLAETVGTSLEGITGALKLAPFILIAVAGIGLVIVLGRK